MQLLSVGGGKMNQILNFFFFKSSATSEAKSEFVGVWHYYSMYNNDIIFDFFFLSFFIFYLGRQCVKIPETLL